MMKSVDYTVGDYVICIRDHTGKRVKKGEIFIIRELAKNPCCGRIIVDVGFRISGNETTCYACNISHEIRDPKHWLAGFLFRKLDKPPIEEALITEINRRLANLQKPARRAKEIRLHEIHLPENFNLKMKHHESFR